MDEVRKNGTLIIVGETGSGKTTRKFVAAISFRCNCCLGQVIVRSLWLSDAFDR